MQADEIASLPAQNVTIRPGLGDPAQRPSPQPLDSVRGYSRRLEGRTEALCDDPDAISLLCCVYLSICHEVPHPLTSRNAALHGGFCHQIMNQQAVGTTVIAVGHASC